MKKLTSKYLYLTNLIFFCISIVLLGMLIMENTGKIGDIIIERKVEKKIQTGIAINGTGGGNRGFDAFFINASTTSFSGLDYSDQGYGYFPVSIKKGKTYRVSAKILDPGNSAQNIITSHGTNFALDRVQLVYNSPSTGSYEFTAIEDAEYIGFGTIYKSDMLSFGISEFLVEQIFK